MSSEVYKAYLADQRKSDMAELARMVEFWGWHKVEDMLLDTPEADDKPDECDQYHMSKDE